MADKTNDAARAHRAAVKRQKRRSISLRPEVYIRLKRTIDPGGESFTAKAERLIREGLDREGAPTVDRADAVAQIEAATTKQPKDAASGVWSF